jgi:hypothetical protein
MLVLRNAAPRVQVNGHLRLDQSLGMLVLICISAFQRADVIENLLLLVESVDASRVD